AACIAVKRTSARVVVLPTNRAELERLVRRFRAPLTSYGGRVDLARASFDPVSAGLLYDRVWRPIIATLPHATRITISPDGALHLLPFDALAPAGGARYVLDSYEISYALGMQFYAPASRLRTIRSLLVVGSPTPGGETE